MHHRPSFSRICYGGLVPGFVLALAALLACTGPAVSAPGGATTPPANPAGQDAGFSFQKLAPFPYVCVHIKGPDPEYVEAVGRLMQAIQSQNIHPTGPMMGVYFNAPDKVPAAEIEWEIGFPVTSQAMPEMPLVKKVWEYRLVAKGLHVGPYYKTDETISKMEDWIAAKGYDVAGPVVERYLDANPNAVKPEDLRTEIWIPVKEK